MNTHPKPAFRKRAVSATVWIVAALYVSYRVAILNRFMVHVDDIVPLMENLRQLRDPWSLKDTFQLSSWYTYPPGQFFLSFPLASLTQEFTTALTLYRLPSLAIWLIGFFGLYRLLRLMLPDAPQIMVLLPVVLGLLSWRGFIESSQGYAYADTVLIVVVFALFSATEQGLLWIRTGFLRAICAGLILGCLPWLTYQALFVGVVCFGTIGLVAIMRRDWRLLGFGVLSGVVFSLPTTVVVWYCLRPAMSFASGLPGWALSNSPGNTLESKLTFPFRAWFDVFQNNLTIIPWGKGSAVIATIALILVLVGLLRLLTTRTLRTAHGPALIFLILMAVIFTAGAYAHLFPLGSTRHSFVLQVPLLMALALACNTLRLSQGTMVCATTLVALVWLVTLPQLLASTGNRVEYPMVQRYFEQWPDTRISDLPGGFTWEITYLARSDPTRLERIKWFIFFSNTQEQATWLMRSPHALMVSHRGAMNDDTRVALLAAGAKSITPLAEVAPGIGTELSGALNGGNGFYLYLIDR